MGVEGVDGVEATPDMEGGVPPTTGQSASKKRARARTIVELHHCDIIGDEFWNSRPNLLAD